MTKDMRKAKLKELLNQNRPVKCEFCGDKFSYQGAGEYACRGCGRVVKDDYGKVKSFLEENGPASAAVVCAATGVGMEIVELMLKEGRLEFQEGQDFYFLKCESCGCSLRYGRFCPDCFKKTTADLKSSFGIESLGEKPGHSKAFSGYLNSDRAGKMRYISEDDKKRR